MKNSLRIKDSLKKISNNHPIFCCNWHKTFRNKYHANLFYNNTNKRCKNTPVKQYLYPSLIDTSKNRTMYTWYLFCEKHKEKIDAFFKENKGPLRDRV